MPVSLDMPPAGVDKVSVLIVDDEPGNCETLADIFTMMGYQADSAGTGEEALGKARDRFYNIAILDIRLPDMYGTELLERIKEIQPLTTCIMVTGYASLQTSMQAINSGAYAYIIKPIDVDKVSGVIRQALEQQRLLFENQRLLRQLRALSDVTDRALYALDLDDLLHSLLRTIIEALSADGGAILLVNESDQRLEVRAAEGGWVADAGRFSVAMGEGFAGRVALEEGPVLVEDASSDDREANVAIRSSEIRSMLGVPLRAKDQTIGVAHVDRTRAEPFTQEEIELIASLANRAGLLIDNVRLYEQEKRLHREAEELAAHQRRSAEELRTLYDVAQALVESMGLEERLERLAGHLTRAMTASRCVIWLSERGTLVPRAFLGVTPAEREAWSHVEIEPAEFGAILQAALSRGEPRVVPDAQEDGLVRTDLPRRQNLRSVLLLPMVINRQVIGVAWLDQPGELRDYAEQELRLGRMIAGQAAVAIENAQAFEQERTVASTLQESLIPRKRHDLPGFDIYSEYKPALEQAQVGGDYYDFIELPDGRLGVVMADVCGKGVTAAVYTAMAKYMLRAYAAEDPSPASVITRLNRSLYSQMSEDCMFITMVYGTLDTQTGEYTYVNAAHPYPLVYHPGRDEVSELPTTGGMVGAMPALEFREAHHQLEPGSVLLLYTDGVTEARDGGEMLEVQGVQAVLRRAAGASARTICDLVYRRALEFSGGSLKDDAAIVAIRALSRAV
jgi:serine phosphatase RsbU (regulator of sigma subunit)/ActR/RegA family two-component response regulator